MYRRLPYDKINEIIEFLHFSREVDDLKFNSYSFSKGTLDNILIVHFHRVECLSKSFIIDMNEYSKWSILRDRKLKINKLKTKMI